MKLVLTGPSGVAKEDIEVSPTTFGREFNEALVHQVVRSFFADRVRTVAQKTRSDVSGGGKKPWRQKGTGRARAGTIRSPLWRGGGKVFAAETRDCSQKVNKKMYRGAMCSILSELVRQDRLIVVEDIQCAQPKTKDLLSHLQAYGLKEALIVTTEWDSNLYLSSRNIARVDVRQVANVDPVSLIKFEKVLMTLGAIRQFEEVLA